jgi:23S rRNA (pseudouridine1915-N3)-methyltransferase
MLTRIICIGRTVDNALASMLEDYSKRVANYTRVKWEFIELPSKYNRLTPEQNRNEEWLRISKCLVPASQVVLLDENGTELTSREFSMQLQKYMNTGKKELVFVIGGAYGFSQKAYEMANAKISLSKMTLTHQMVRLLFIEQLYRAHTILKNEKYHH